MGPAACLLWALCLDKTPQRSLCAGPPKLTNQVFRMKSLLKSRWRALLDTMLHSLSMKLEQSFSPALGPEATLSVSSRAMLALRSDAKKVVRRDISASWTPLLAR